jgi:hypothetical protein
VIGIEPLEDHAPEGDDRGEDSVVETEVRLFEGPFELGLAEQAFERQIRSLWPALKGSLAKVRKPCVRPNCPACARGDKHPAWIFTVSQKGRRRCLYVPEALVPAIRLALRNGRRLEELLSRMGPAFVQAYRRERDNPKTAVAGRSKS